MFDNIYIYNFFPTDIGEENTLIKGISTLKMLLINNIVGSDTKTLTPDETLQSYFRNRYEEADEKSNDRSWDNEYRNIYNSVKHNMSLADSVYAIPERARIVRKNQGEACAISFAKRGDNTLFAYALPSATQAQIVPADKVLHLFASSLEENGYEYDEELDRKFKILRDEIKKPHPKIKMDKRKSEALENLQQLLVVCPTEKDYLADLIDVIKKYDDLSDGELKYLAAISVKKGSATDTLIDLKRKIPVHYIIQIKTRVEAIDAQAEVIMFTEDLRNDND